MRIRVQSLLVSTLILVVGCDSWPPYQDEASNNFLENQESFRALGTKFMASEFTSVYLGTNNTAIGMIDGAYGPERQLIDNDPEWAELLSKALVSRVLRRDYAVVFVPPAPHSKDGRDTEISYMHFVGGDPDLIECEPKFEDLECGVCGVELAENWWIDYMWYPMPILESEFQMYLDGTLPEDEYFKLQGAALTECQINGLEAIGYGAE